MELNEGGGDELIIVTTRISIDSDLGPKEKEFYSRSQITCTGYAYNVGMGTTIISNDLYNSNLKGPDRYLTGRP